MIENISYIDIFKYLAVVAIVYYILKCIPSQNISQQDILLLTVIIIIIFITIDYKCFKNNSELFTEITNITQPVIPDSQPIMQPVVPDPQPIVQQVIPDPQPVVQNCSYEVNKVKYEMQDQINNLKDQIINTNNSIGQRYFDTLLDELLTANMLSKNEIDNIYNKIKLKLLTFDEAIKSLEALRLTIPKNNNPQNDMIYNELPAGFLSPIGDKIANDWEQDDVLLNTNRWAVPVQQPPMCINTNPSAVYPSSSSNIVNLKDWDNSRVFTKTNINKQWANKQDN